MKNIQFKVTIYKEGGWTAESIGGEAIVSQGDSISNIGLMLSDAIETHIKGDRVVFELATPTETLMSEIGDSRTTRDSLAKTYRLALASTEDTDWGRVNRAIIDRWSFSALEYIKRNAILPLPLKAREDKA